MALLPGPPSRSCERLHRDAEVHRPNGGVCARVSATSRGEREREEERP